MADDATLLTNVKAAINSILIGGQSYTIGSRTFTRADLKQLRELRQELEARARKASPTGNVTHVEFNDSNGRADVRQRRWL